jgi:hypothetical protein
MDHMEISACILSCPERETLRSQTLKALAATDWGAPARVELDSATSGNRQERQSQAALRLLQHSLDEKPDFILFLEDDLVFNHHLRHNLTHWQPFTLASADEPFFASLYNPNISRLESHAALAFFIARPEAVYGSQAMLLSLSTAKDIVAHWEDVSGMQDIKISRLAARKCPLYYHTPSLVQHVGKRSVWGGQFHTANDFQESWRADQRQPQSNPALPRSWILAQMRGINGWLDEGEANLLIDLASHLAAAEQAPQTVVEVGSYCGKATITVGQTLRAARAQSAKIYAIDSFDGAVSAVGGGMMQTAANYATFEANLLNAGLMDRVIAIQGRASEIAWGIPISLLIIDGLHDYESVKADFAAFSPWVVTGGRVAFHDYSSAFKDVARFVGEIQSTGCWQQVSQVKSLLVLEKR